MAGAIDRAVRSLAARQRGVVTRRQALALGMTDRMIEHRVSEGAWVRIKPGTFFLFGHATTLEAQLAAATSALPAVVSHESAAELHDLPWVPRGRAVVSVPSRCTYRFPGVRVHQLTDLREEFITEVIQLPVTTIPRTIVDLAAVLSERRLERVVEESVLGGKVGFEDVMQVFSLVARRGKPGVRRLRRVLEARGKDLALSESVLEARLFELLVEAGLPEPVRQHPLPWRTSAAGRVDLAYPEARLLIEADGRRWHATVGAFEADRRRDNLALLAGWRVLRFSWEDVMEQSREVVLVVRQALESPQARSAG